MSFPTPAAVTSGSSAGLLDLPNELLAQILPMLPFDALLHTSRTCRRLRVLALADRSLWQDLPVVCPSSLRLIKPFIDQSGCLGFELAIDNILISDLPLICPFVYDNLKRIQSLQLTFVEPELDFPLVDDALTLLNITLSRPAPLLHFLALNGFFYSPLGPLWPNILGGTMAPHLRIVHLTAFELETPCPAFAGVEIVVASVGALAPLPDPTENQSLHALFPALQNLELTDLDPDLDAEPEDYYALTRVPTIDRPLSSLLLSWHRSMSPSDILEDGPTVAWLEGCMQHVKKLDVTYEDCPAAWQTVFASAAATADSLCIIPNDEVTLELSLCSSERDIERTVSVTPSQAQKTLTGQEFGNLDTLALSTDGACIELLSADSWGKLAGLRELCLLIDWDSVVRSGPDAGSFIEPAKLGVIAPLKSIRTVCIQAHADWQRERNVLPRSLSAEFMLEFIKTVTPNARKVDIYDVELFGRAVFARYPQCEFLYSPPY